jgi:catechol 2,3-dioxygenase-like lactoylglutathione lyase family enzyme
MKKKKQKKTSAPKAGAVRAKKRAATSPSTQSIEAKSGSAPKLHFNHAMVYVADVDRAIGFYRDLLGFHLIEDFRHENKPVYARLRAPGGDGTIALHQAGQGASVASDGVRLYFEVKELDDFCRELQEKNFYVTQLPKMMPWGWRHAYLNDPDGHEISLYWAGENRMKPTVMKAAQKAARASA